MDFTRPIEALIPGAQGRLLAVLARAGGPLNLRTLADLAGVSAGQASRVLPRLVELGLVRRTEAPPSALFELAQGHLATRVVRALAEMRGTLIEELERIAEELDPQPLTVVLFGSMATGESRADSDIDILLVRPRRIPEDDDGWDNMVNTFVQQAEGLSGNAINVIEVSERESASTLRSRRAPWRDISRQGIVIAGRSLDELTGSKSA